MAKFTKELVVKAVFSNKALQALYDLRQALRDENVVRTRAAMMVCMALLVVATALLVATSWVPHDVRSYIASRSNIQAVEDKHLSWRASDAIHGDCGGVHECYTQLKQNGFRFESLAEIDALKHTGQKAGYLLINLEIQNDAVASLIATQRIVVLGLPRFNFNRAHLFVNGGHMGFFFSGARLFAHVETSQLKPGAPVAVEALLEVLPSDRTLAGLRNQEGVMIASQGEYEAYRDFLGAKNTNASGQMGMLAKIVLALFCLLLFLIIDSSPESYGLALFMGFEAAAMGIGAGWLPLGFLGIDRTPILIHYCYQMGDFLKLYFLLQIARVGPTSAKHWLLWGTLISVPYGFFREYADTVGMNWAYKMSLWRDTFVGVIGGTACFRALWMIRDRSLPWRKAALVTAGIAGYMEVTNSWLAHSDVIRIYPGIKTLYTVLQANIGYFFALSTFLNISTLENRVKSLSKAKMRADEIERELEVGQIVQQALLKPPQLPETVDLRCHHEAALYVSGDTYYANWNKEKGIVTFLVNDVTGHGVQAALKASACNVLAKTIWENEHPDHLGFGDGSRIAEFDRVTQKLLVEMNMTPDFNSMIAAEFNVNDGTMALYRSNFTFPILITPKVAFAESMEPVLGEFWTPEVLASRNHEIVVRAMPRGSFVLFLSDGFMESSRDAKLFTAYMRRQLAQRDYDVTCDVITEIVLKFDGFTRRKVVDDRTLLVFQWTHPAVISKRRADQQWIALKTTKAQVGT